MDKKFRMDEKLATGVLMGVWEETFLLHAIISRRLY